jgi:hypothetical protein
VANSFMILGFQGFPQNSLNHGLQLSCFPVSSDHPCWLQLTANKRNTTQTTRFPNLFADGFAGYRVVC